MAGTAHQCYPEVFQLADLGVERFHMSLLREWLSPHKWIWKRAWPIVLLRNIWIILELRSGSTKFWGRNSKSHFKLIHHLAIQMRVDCSALYTLLRLTSQNIRGNLYCQLCHNPGVSSCIFTISQFGSGVLQRFRRYHDAARCTLGKDLAQNLEPLS